MAGVRKDGILEVTGGGAAPATPVDIVASITLPIEIEGPIGSNVSADSVSVVIASDQSPIPVDISAPITLSGPVDQGEPNPTIGDAWPIKITDEVDIAAVANVNDGLTAATKGLVTQSIQYIKNNDSTVTPWTGDASFATFASGNHPWVKALRSSILSGNTDLGALDSFLAIDLQERSVEAATFFLSNSSLIGTLQFIPTPGGNNNSLRIYNTRLGTWELGTIVDPTLDTLYIIPCSGLKSVQVLITSYSSGQITAQYSAGPGVGALYADVSGSTVITDGLTDAQLRATSVPVDTELPAAALLTDNTANPTVPGVAAFGMVYDGSTWDRAPGNSVNGQTVNLGFNNDVVPGDNVGLIAGDITSLNDVVNFSLIPKGFNCIGFALTNAGPSFVGTVEFRYAGFGGTVPIYHVKTGKWITSLTNIPAGPTQVNAFLAPIFPGGPLQVFCTAYSSGTCVVTGANATLSPLIGAPLTNVELAERINTLGQKTMAESTPVVIASDQSPINVEVQSTTAIFRGRSATFNTPGRAGTVGQKILSIHNATGSPVIIRVRKVTVDLYQTVVKVITVAPPNVRVWKVTVLPTNGTLLAKTKIGGSGVSNAAVTVRGDASADSTGSGTTLTATLPTGTFIAQEYAGRFITGVGYEPADRMKFEFDQLVELQALEGLVVFLDYVLATQNPTTDRWTSQVEWDEN